jgi:hypothetical protein
MADRTPIRTIPRALRRRKRLGPHSVCAICGYCDPVALIPVRLDWLRSTNVRLPHTLLEGDHTVGRRNDCDLISPICRNCHAELTEIRTQMGISMKRQPNPHLRIAVRFEAQAIYRQKELNSLCHNYVHLKGISRETREALLAEAWHLDEQIASLRRSAAIARKGAGK